MFLIIKSNHNLPKNEFKKSNKWIRTQNLQKCHQNFPKKNKNWWRVTYNQNLVIASTKIQKHPKNAIKIISLLLFLVILIFNFLWFTLLLHFLLFLGFSCDPFVIRRNCKWVLNSVKPTAWATSTTDGRRTGVVAVVGRCFYPFEQSWARGGGGHGGGWTHWWWTLLRAWRWRTRRRGQELL